MQLRRVFGFCKAKVYIERFSNLQAEVNRLQSEVVEKQQYLDRMNKVRDLTFQDRVRKIVGEFMNMPFQSKGMISERSRKDRLLKEAEELEKQVESKLQIAQKHKKEEQTRRQTNFLTDLARFNLKYQEILKPKALSQEVQSGLQLSTKALAKILTKEGVEWLGNVQQSYNSQIHERMEGEGEIVKQVIQQGFKLKGKVITKAKVSLKK